jgi:hypothetical protein
VMWLPTLRRGVGVRDRPCGEDRQGDQSYDRQCVASDAVHGESPSVGAVDRMLLPRTRDTC